MQGILLIQPFSGKNRLGNIYEFSSLRVNSCAVEQGINSAEQGINSPFWTEQGI